MNTNISNWKKGVRDGIPICLGYFAVSFTFGIMAKNAGLTPFQAVLMSATNITSAGQFAALGLIGASSTYIEMAFTQLVINLRYCLMSCSLSQKINASTDFSHRFLVAFGITDEIFGVSVCKEGKLHPFYNYGLMTSSIPGWTLGTFCGVLSGSLLPERIVSALSIALYAMFIAVIIPPAKGNKILSGIILLSMLVSFLFAKISVLSEISSGFKIILLTLLIAGIAARLFPIQEVANEQ
ncbi:branched-chain amino acid ABC transporter permease [Heliobacterium gestii]|uniref:Branched-chain amino acid ABC transporter permease n=1 Tax=Heliomicrobium gestii TaxID=2699 RepID=A0A845LIB2_HELGE|nr:AzlC family ABC transporter permease [Heliomicrobium gestii]MBM7867762.1 putative branched-subunit amino acid permease [Heliomicrobium gestii]MZP44155.1 branched-chain amino acid ABC transporter permease [Heliomicrobium gestii]